MLEKIQEKTIQTKDIYNLKQDITHKNEDGLFSGKLLCNALKHLNEITAVDVDEIQ